MNVTGDGGSTMGVIGAQADAAVTTATVPSAKRRLERFMIPPRVPDRVLNLIQSVSNVTRVAQIPLCAKRSGTAFRNCEIHVHYSCSFTDHEAIADRWSAADGLS